MMKKKILMLCMFGVNIHHAMGQNITTPEKKESFVFSVISSKDSGLAWRVTAPESQKPARVEEIKVAVTALDETFSPIMKKTDREYDPLEFYKRSNKIVVAVTWKKDAYHEVAGESFYDITKPHSLRAFEIFYNGDPVKTSQKKWVKRAKDDIMNISLKTLEAFLQQKKDLIDPALTLETNLQKCIRSEMGILKAKELKLQKKKKK